MLKVVLKSYIDRPQDAGYTYKPDPHPDVVTLTTVDPNLTDLLNLIERFIVGMGFYPPPGDLDYIDDSDGGDKA